MNLLSLVVFLVLFPILAYSYNPIPVGCVVISTTNKIFVLNPKEYGGSDTLNVIYTAGSNMTIVSTIYEPVSRILSIMYTNDTNGTLYLSRLKSRETLDSITYQLPMRFTNASIYNNSSISSDAANGRAFFTNENGSVTLFSTSGLMKVPLSIPSTILDPVHSVSYASANNRLYVITDSILYSCSNLDTNTLQCCQGAARLNKLRAVAFDTTTGDLLVYVLDLTAGIYQAPLDSNGCATAFYPINRLGDYDNRQFVIDRGLYFASGGMQNQNDNSLLIIANGTQVPRVLPIGSTIVTLHISYPDLTLAGDNQETCFHGITYNDYRTAVILAAVFGTIMGIFMCFNTLCCIDFFMTKSIIRHLKSQIPHDLLEDRWNRLIEEKYAKVALDKQRQQEMPLPPTQRKSSMFVRQPSIAPAPATTTSAETHQNREDIVTPLPLEQPRGGLQVPRVKAFLRRKSDDYFSRRRSDNYQSSYNPPNTEMATSQLPTVQTNQNYIGPVPEETPTRSGLRPNLSGQKLIKFDEDFL